MRHFFFFLLSAVIIVCFSSCDTFWEGMAQGAGGYGMYRPMGFYGKPYLTAPVTPVTYPTFVPSATYSSMPVVTSSSTSSSTTSSGSTSSGNSSSRDCRRCMGTGKCQTCNGRGYYDVIGIGSGRHACPNCASNHNGRCASCNGTGKM